MTPFFFSREEMVELRRMRINPPEADRSTRGGQGLKLASLWLGACLFDNSSEVFGYFRYHRDSCTERRRRIVVECARLESE